MKIAIVGSGAVGLYYGARLQSVGEDVHFLLRSDFEVIREKGIELVAPDGGLELESVNAYLESEEIGICDLVIVALKTTANHALGKMVDPLVGEGTRVLTLQNGLGNDSLLAERYGEGRTMGGLCFVCLNRTAPGRVENYHLGSIAIGAYRRGADDFVHELGQLFERAGVKCRVYDDLQLVQWKKLVWNVPFNGLAIAAGGVTTDVILADDGLRALVRELMNEIIDAAAALGMSIDRKMVDQQIEITYPMKAYKPSSLIDFLDKKPVEVEAIWGEAYRQAVEAGVEAPRLGMLYRLLSALCETQ